MSDCGCEGGQACTTAPVGSKRATANGPLAGFSGNLLALFGGVLGTVVLLAVLGEWFGVLGALTGYVPWPVWLVAVLIGGYPIFRAVLRAAFKFRVTSHTLMTAGLVAAVAVGEWPAAVLIVFFMRLADYIEQFTATRARSAVRDLTAMAPETARVERDGAEIEVPVGRVRVGARARRSRSTVR